MSSLAPSSDPAARSWRRATAALLPPSDVSLLMRACLDPDPGTAWSTWLESATPDPVTALSVAAPHSRRLGPLLAWNLGRAGIEISDEPLRIGLRAATTRERERAQTMMAGVATALDVVAGTGADATVLGGVDLTHRAYPDLALRHCHDLDLLVRADQRDAAVTALVEIGGLAPLPAGSRGSIVVGHPKGAPVSMHTRLIATAGTRLTAARALEGRGTVDIGGTERQVLAPAALLVHLIGRGILDSPARSALWAIDAGVAITSLDQAIDWDRVGALAQAARLDAVLAAGLGYLARNLGVPVPAGGLALAARTPTTAGSDLAVFAAARNIRRESGGGSIAAGLGAGSAVALVRQTPRYLTDRLRPGA